MTNKELQLLLSKWPDEMPIKLLPDTYRPDITQIPFTEDHILHTSETAYLNDEAPDEEWDHEDGKIELGDGIQYLLINPIIH